MRQFAFGNLSLSRKVARELSSRFSYLSAWGCVALIVVAMIASVGANAQMAGTGAISGTVTDASGAVIGGATVTATLVSQNTSTIRTTTGAGDYSITPLLPGQYTLTVTATGFEKFVQENVTVDALQTVAVNIKLSVGTAEQTITVTTAPPVLETSDASLGAVMDNEMYSSLPLLMGQGGNNDQRRATDFSYLMPGVQNTYQASSSSNSTDATGGVNGGNPSGGTSEIYIDGINLPEADGVGDPRFTWTAFGVDAIDQFQVLTTGYSSQYGGQGVQNYSIKSGSNQIHGSVYEYLRNTVLDAWSPTAKTPTPIAGQAVPAGGKCTSAALAASTSWCALGGLKPKEIQNEVGLALGGPIIKNKLFAFYNYGQYRNQNGPKPSIQTLPTAAMLGFGAANPGVADFSQLLPTYTIYDPNTEKNYNCSGGPGSTPASTNPCVRTAFAGNLIPASRISAASKFTNNLMQPLESSVNQSAVSNNLVAGFPTGLANWYNGGRIDYNPNDKHQISIIVAFGRQASTGTNSGGTLPPPFNTSQSYAPKTNIDIVKDTWTINSHLVNMASLAFGRYKSISFTPNELPAYAASNTGLLDTPVGQASFFPAVAFTADSSAADPATYGGYDENGKINNTYTAADNFQWLHGKHNFTFGGQWVQVQFNYDKNLTYSGPMTYTFAGPQTEGYTTTGTAVSNSGLSLASYMLGGATSGTVSVGVPGLGSRWNDPSLWVQDDYKISPKLTVNLGLRWDIWTPIHEAHDLFTWLNPTGANSLTGNLGTLAFAGGSSSDGFHTGTHVLSSTWMKNFAPRLGVAYAVDAKTVIRASYGLAYAHGDWTGGSQSGSPSTSGLTPTASTYPAFGAQPSFYWDGTACTSAAGGVTDTGGNGYAPVGSMVAGDGFTPCGWTGSTAPPSSVLPSGANLSELYSVETATLKGANNGSVTYWDPHYGSRTPEYENWSFGIERQITRDMSISVSYVGSEGHFLSIGNARYQTNNKLPESYAALAGYALPSSTSNPNTTAACSGTGCLNSLIGIKGTATYTTGYIAEAESLGFTPPNPFSSLSNYYSIGNTVGAYFVNFPQFSGVTDTTSFVGNENWNALEISVKQRPSHGLNWMLNYTYSKNIDDLGSFRVYDNNRLDRSISTGDQPQNLIGTVVYALPAGRGHMFGDNWAYRAIASDWLVSGIETFHSGQPIQVIGSGCAGSSILNQCMPSIVPGQPGRQYNYGKTPGGAKATWDPSSPNYIGNVQYINPAAFTVLIAGTCATTGTGAYHTYNGQAYNVCNGPEDYVPGNAPRVAPLNMFAQGWLNTDMALKRSFPIYHEWKAAFELDMANVTNHVVYGPPGQSGTTVGKTSTVQSGTNASFGTLTQVNNTPREVQGSLRISF
ncbi:MAG: TonB-dependent receptor [Terracidiphilus sp.]|jgi:hypothetical protein